MSQNKVIFAFPGQGSQSLAMMDKLNDDFPEVKYIFDKASAIVGYDMWAMLHEETAENINKTIYTQPLLYVAGYATYCVWQQTNPKIKPLALAGHSLGEWVALVAANVISFEDGLKLVCNRAKYMQEAVPEGKGAMAVVLGLSEDVVVASCALASKNTNSIVEAANFNSPIQIVISGEKLAVDEAMTIIKTKGAKIVKLLPVSIPSHCQLMRSAADKLALDLENITMYNAQLPIIQNVSAKAVTDFKIIKDNIIKQMYLSVEWTKSVQAMQELGANKFVECGPGNVLNGLVKRIAPEFELFALHDKNEIDVFNESLNHFDI